MVKPSSKLRLCLWLALACIVILLAGCEDGAGKEETVVRERPQLTNVTAAAGVMPKPPEQTSKQVQYIDMDAFSNSDLMMVTTLQGLVNRVQPSLYVIHDEIVEGTSGFNGSQFWFDQLDKQYTGDQAFAKTAYTDPYQLVVDNKDRFKGAILYHERLTDGDMASRSNYPSRYGDMALLNLTLMLSAKYDAIALDYMQYNILKEDYGLELEILGDTTKFMPRGEDGSFLEERGSREVWASVYRYAIANLAGDMNDSALGHNPGFQAANFDYYVANDIFIYNRIFSADASEEELEIEQTILGLSKPSTPFLGVWYLQADEGNFVPMLTEKYKFNVVTYESFNLSWTSGLPYEPFTPEEPPVKLDKTKKYIAFSFTEGDNNSYQQWRMPLQFQNKKRGEYPIGWSMAATLWDTNPNIIRYLRDNWASGDGLVMGEAGAGYVYHTPPRASQNEFFALSDAYFERTGVGAMRVLNSNKSAPLVYAEKMNKLDSLFLGYIETNNEDYNSDLSHYLFRDTPVFVNYNGRTASALANSDGGSPAFYAVTLPGWETDPGTVANIMEALGDEFVAVTPQQLAGLYREYYGDAFKQVVQAEFDSGMTRSEMGFLYRAGDYGSYSELDGTRIADGEDYFIYKFDLAADVTQARLDVQMAGNYRIEASTDDLHWHVAASGRLDGKGHVAVDVSEQLVPGEPLYVRFGDATTENDNGAVLYHLQLTTDKSAYDRADIVASHDEAWLQSGDARGSAGRTGVFEYRIPLRADFQSGDLAIAASGPVTALVSTDQAQYRELPLAKVNNGYYAQLSDMQGTIYLKIDAASSEVTEVKLSPTPEPVGEFSFSPVENDRARQLFISSDPTKAVNTGYNSYREIKDDNAMIYRFVTEPEVTDAKLSLQISGLYRVMISGDGANYEELIRLQEGDAAQENPVVDIAKYAAGGKKVYVKIDSSSDLSGKTVKLLKLRLLTNRTSEALLGKIDRQREPTAVLQAGSKQEEALLDQEMSAKYFMYEGKARGLQPDADAAIVYRLDLAGSSLFDLLQLQPDKLTRLRMSMNIGNAYKISVSADGSNWTEVADSDDEFVQSASNLKDVSIPLSTYIGGPVYVKVSQSGAYVPNQTHDGLIWNLKLYLN